tara:strand:+ start:119 stop:478 length:360 start_codon:yes stop_codon:yes gene_type:complete
MNTDIKTKEETKTETKLCYTELLPILFQKYPWFEDRFNSMDQQHQTGFKITLGEENSIALHLSEIFDRCLSEDKKTLPLNTWRLKRAEYKLFMLLGVPDEDNIIEPIQEIILATGMELK